ncbi:DUF6538 domain-containing protein [Tardiphaga sp. 1201_B9_N1_1]|uniref:DUF6538 domain-containing protein n=1 Tax=unclassified Tardiphaga TaxID=2631404 RepID=UPI00359BB5F4
MEAPDSGDYCFRRGVPDDLREFVGQREERLSLGTRDTVEVKRLHALKLVEIEERWSNLRQSQRPLASIRPAGPPPPMMQSWCSAMVIPSAQP